MVYRIRNKGFDIFSAATTTRVHTAKKTKIGSKSKKRDPKTIDFIDAA